jgi:hypothetical protein
MGTKHEGLARGGIDADLYRGVGHGSEWINDARLADPVSKALCCGPIDCSVLAPGSVERVQGAYKVNTGWWKGYDPFFVAWDRACRSHPMGTTISVSALRMR